MAVEENRPAAVAPGRTAYGRVIRERGTRRLLLAVAALAFACYVYNTVHVHQMNQVQWPTLTPVPTELTVLGLRDKDRAGWRHKYEAVESNHSWHIRRPEYEADSGEGGENTPESHDRGNDPGAGHRVNRGEVVTIEELMQECPTVLTGALFTDAGVEERQDNGPPPFNRKYYIVHLGLSPEAHSRFWQFSREHEGERLVFVLNNEIVTCTRMDNTPPPYLYVFVGSLDIQPIWVKADAERLADFINKQKR